MSHRNPTDIEATKYAESFVIHGCKTTAFKYAFPRSRAKPEVMNVTASRLHDLPKVCLRIEELHKQINSDADQAALYTAEQALNELDEAKELAQKNDQAAPMVSSIMGKAKIAGLLVDNVNQQISSEMKVRNFADFYKDQ